MFLKNNYCTIPVVARAALLLFFIMVRTNLNILQWNARGLGCQKTNSTSQVKNSKVNNLNNLLSNLGYPDIVCIQEPLTKENQTIHFPHYNYEVIHKGPGCRGLLTLIKNTHTYKLLDTYCNRFVTSHTIEIHINNQTKMHITNYYRNWSEKSQNFKNIPNAEDLLGHPLKQNLLSHCIVGDFNSHNLLWGSKKNTLPGKIIAKIIEQEELTLHNTGGTTRIGQRPNEDDSSIDLTLTQNMEGICVHT